MRNTVSQLKNLSDGFLFRSIQQRQSAHPAMFKVMSSKSPVYQRCFSILNGEGGNGLDRSKFTHEVKVIMPNVSEDEDAKGEILCIVVIHAVTMSMTELTTHCVLFPVKMAKAKF